MKKWLVISDSFKGTLSSADIGRIAKQTIKQYFPEDEVITIPVADGGEGTVDCFLEAIPGERISRQVTGPDFKPLIASYGLFGDTAVIEMAAAAGLPLIDHGQPDQTTTYGVGELMQDAISRGVRQLVLGLGGSATNDAGCGAVAALGGRFYNQAGESFIPTGGTLIDFARIDLSDIKLDDVELTVMCDIDNPLHGPQGAAYVFSPQKGADPAMVRKLDEGLRRIDEIFEQQLSQSVALLPGAGAAGGMGAGMVACLGARLKPGIDIVLDMIQFEDLIEDVDLILTGEGKLDAQSLGGKVVVGVARRAQANHVPVIALVGQLSDGIEPVYHQGVSAVFTTNRSGLSFAEIKQRDVAEDYRRALEDILRLKKLNR